LAASFARRVSAEQQIFAHRQFAENAAALRHQRDAGLDDSVRRRAGEILARQVT
jgi:hypothetical protein